MAKIPLIPAGSPAVFSSPGLDSLLGSCHTGPGTSNKPGASELVDFANMIQWFFVRIEWLRWRPVCTIL